MRVTRMKRLLLCLVPWMAMTAVAQQDVPKLAQVVYTNVGPANAWRIGDDCYVAPSVLSSWHWPYNLIGNDANIEAEGRKVRVTATTVQGRLMIPLRSTLDQLGGVCAWREDGTTLDVYGLVRIVDLQRGKLSIDSTLSFKPHVFAMQNPSRVVVDMRGMRLDPKAADGLPGAVKVSQYSPDTVRVVVETDDAPSFVGDASSTRHFEVRLGGKRTNESTQPIKPPVRNSGDEDPPAIHTDQFSGGATPEIGSLQLVEDGARSSVYKLPISRPVGTPNVAKIDSTTYQVAIPGARFIGVNGPVKSKGIAYIESQDSSDGTILTVRLVRPMNLEVAAYGSEIQLMLTNARVTTSTGSGNLSGKIIVIDPGHGGTDSGARSPGKDVNEKDLTLAISRYVAEALEREGATVYMTRNSDVFIPLPDRPAVANREHADFFVSIHINSNKTNNSQTGTYVYYHGRDVTSQALAKAISEEVGNVNGLRARGVLSDTTRYDSGFAVLRGSKVPAVLVETGYINNDGDRSKMVTAEFQRAMAIGVVRGLKVFLGNGN